MPKISSWEPRAIPEKRQRKRKKPRHKQYRKKHKIKPSAELKRARIRVKKIRVIKRRMINRNASHIKFNRRKRLIICAGVENRLPLARAAALAGVSSKTVYQWMAKGKDHEKNPTHFFFRKKIKRLQAEVEQEALDIIREASKGGAKILDTSISFGPKGTEIKRRTKTLAPSWAAAAWFLERRHRDSYGKDVISSELERTPEEFAREVRDVAKSLFDSVPLRPLSTDLQEVKNDG